MDLTFYPRRPRTAEQAIADGCLHRKKPFLQAVSLRTSYPSLSLADIGVCALLLPDQKWYIAPSWTGDEDRMTDIGPFDTAEAAVLYIQLHRTDL